MTEAQFQALAQLLRLRAADAEFQMGNGNPPCIEISATASVRGFAQEFEITAEGIETETLDDE